MNRCVLDSSALLALFEKEQGWEKVKAALPDGIVSSLTLAEVVTRLTLRGGKPWEIAAAWDQFADVGSKSKGLKDGKDQSDVNAAK